MWARRRLVDGLPRDRPIGAPGARAGWKDERGRGGARAQTSTDSAGQSGEEMELAVLARQHYSTSEY